jgi:glucosyl-3-phosphoglycerate synthase
MAILDTDLSVSPSIATYRHAEWEIAELVAAKGNARIVVCIPARDEVRTIGAIVSCIRHLLETSGLVDEILVVDDGSRDGTGVEALRHGAAVAGGPGLGKGEAMAAAKGRGDYVVYLDGDVENFAVHYVTGLLGPLLCGSGLLLVKGSYARPLGEHSTGGGRVTELVAKPLISLLFPDLCGVDQPLAGETAVRSEVLEEIELASGYGVEMGLLIDVWQRWGTDCIAQVDLGERRHRNRPLAELGLQAREVIDVALARETNRRRSR